MKCRILIALLTSVSLANADGWHMEANGEHVQQFKVDSQTQLAELTLTISNHTTDNLHYTSDRVSVSLYENPKGVPRSCTFTTSTDLNKLDCGIRLVPIGMGGYDVSYVYLFLMKKRQNGWVQILVDPETGRTLWLRENDQPPVRLKIRALTSWVLGEQDVTFVIPVSDGINIRSARSDHAPIAATCGSTQIEFSTETSGEWVNVLCASNCKPRFTRVLGCGDEDSAEDAREAALPACSEGWIRWIDSNGQLLIGPIGGTGCD